MAFTQPKSMNEVIYFTNRTLEKGGRIKAWVYRKDCPKCKVAKMGKPLDSKTGRPKIRSMEYSCPNCGFTEEKIQHEESLQIQAVYVCPECGKPGESSAPYKRRSYMGVPSFVVDCQHCGAKMGLTKKLKTPKDKKKSKDEDYEGDEDDN